MPRAIWYGKAGFSPCTAVAASVSSHRTRLWANRFPVARLSGGRWHPVPDRSENPDPLGARRLRVRHLADARDGAASRRLSQSCTCWGERYPGRGRIRSCRDASAYSAGRAGTDGPPGQMEGNRWPSPPTFIPPRLQTPGRTRGAPSRGPGRTDPDSSGVGTRRPVLPHLSCGGSPDGGRTPQPHSLNPQTWHFTQPSS